jgi:hypothetical protein
MNINVSAIQPRDTLQKILARVSFHDPNGPPHNSAVVDVFIEHTDSYAEIRKRAIEAAREFFKKALAAEAVETPE